MVVPQLVLVGCIEAMKTTLSSGCPMVAVACKRHRRQHLESIPTRFIIHTCVLAVATSGISHHKSKVTL